MISKHLLRRKLYKSRDAFYPDSDDRYKNSLIEVTDDLEADLVSSLTDKKGHHLPVFDFDFPCYVVESVDPEHSHVYLDVAMPWDNYKKLLDTLLEVGLIEHGWYENAIEDKQSFVRTEERSKHDRIHGKTSNCYPDCVDERGNIDPKYKVDDIF